MPTTFDAHSKLARHGRSHTCLLISDIPILSVAIEGVLSGLEPPTRYTLTITWREARLALMSQSFDLVFVCCRGNFSRELAALDRAFRSNTWLAMPLSGNSGLVGLARDRRNIQLVSFSTSAERLRDVLNQTLSRGSVTVEPVIDRASAATLTSQEHRVLELLTDGLSTKRIADELNYAPGTVRNCLSKTYRKLGVTDRTSAALVFSRLYQRDASDS